MIETKYLDVKRTTLDNALPTSLPSSTDQVTVSSEAKSSQGIMFGKAVNQAVLENGHTKTKRAAPSHLSIFEPCGSENDIGAQTIPNEELPNAVLIIGQLADAVTSLRNTIVSTFFTGHNFSIFLILLV